MSTTTQHQAAENTAAMELSPVLSARFALSWKHVLVCAWFAVFFVYLNYVPLFHSDIWGHVHYGKWAIQHGHFPQQDPFMPLAEGMHAVNTAWLAQLIFAGVDMWGGPQFLSNLFAVTVLATYVIYARAFYTLTGRFGLALLGTALVLFIGWSRHAIIRPEIFGGLSCALLVWMVIQGEPWRSRRPGHAGDASAPARMPWAVWIGVPLLFLFWANVHGSFLVGLAILGCHAAGRVLEVAWRTRSLSAVLADGWVRRWTLLTELALAATLANPAGIDLLIESVRFGQNPNLRDVLEWFPLRATMFEGVQFGMTLIAMMFLLRFSRRRIAASDVLMLLLFGISVGPTIRMIGWWAPVFTLTMLPHMAELWTRLLPEKKKPRALAQPAADPVAAEMTLTPAHFIPSLVCLLLVWSAFAISPISEPLLSGKPRKPEQLYSQATPLGVTAWLRQHPPHSLVFGPQWWSDWLAWDGPQGMKLFVTTHIHLVPRVVWRDYMRIARGQDGWDATLDRYGVKLLVVDKELQQIFAGKVRRSTKWKTVYEDDRAMVLERWKNSSVSRAASGGNRESGGTGTSADAGQTDGGSEAAGNKSAKDVPAASSADTTGESAAS